jgi:hypothetical protein
MIDTDKYEGHTEAPWDKLSEYCPVGSIDKQLIADAPLLLEFIQKVVEEWGKPNQCNKAFGKDVRHLMLEYGLINYNEETRRYEVKE